MTRRAQAGAEGAATPVAPQAPAAPVQSTASTSADGTTPGDAPRAMAVDLARLATHAGDFAALIREHGAEADPRRLDAALRDAFALCDDRYPDAAALAGQEFARLAAAAGAAAATCMEIAARPRAGLATREFGIVHDTARAMLDLAGRFAARAQLLEVREETALASRANASVPQTTLAVLTTESPTAATRADGLPPPRADLARVVLATLPAAERREVYLSVRDFLRALHGAHVVESLSDALREAFDQPSAAHYRDSAAEAVTGVAEMLAAAPQRHAIAAVCALLMGADPARLAATIGEDCGLAEARRVRRGLRLLRAAYLSTRGGAR